MLRKDFEIEYYFPDEWLKDLHSDHPGWFDSFIVDIEGNISSLSIKDNSKNSFQKNIFLRMESSTSNEWLSKWLPILTTIETSLIAQQTKLKSG